MPPELDARKWNNPIGKYTVKVGGVLVPINTTILPDGKKYEVNVSTMCGKEQVDLEGTPREAMSAMEFVRITQIVASMGHVTRRACRECLVLYREGLTPHEKRFLKMAEPKLGPIIGFAEDEPALVDEKGNAIAQRIERPAPAIPSARRATTIGDLIRQAGRTQ